jgi:hypothetical protein
MREDIRFISLKPTYFFRHPAANNDYPDCIHEALFSRVLAASEAVKFCPAIIFKFFGKGLSSTYDGSIQSSKMTVL